MSARPNIVLAVVAGLVVVMAVIAGLFSANRQLPDLDPRTPEGTVQLYVLAIIDSDDEEAVAFLDPALGCTAPLRNLYRPQRLSMTVAGTKTTGGRATVTLNLTEYSGTGLLDSWEHRETFELMASGDRWIITGNPWPVYACK